MMENERTRQQKQNKENIIERNGKSEMHLKAQNTLRRHQHHRWSVGNLRIIKKGQRMERKRDSLTLVITLE